MITYWIRCWCSDSGCDDSLIVNLTDSRRREVSRNVREGVSRFDVLKWEAMPWLLMAPFHGKGSWTKLREGSEPGPSIYFSLLPDCECSMTTSLKPLPSHPPATTPTQTWRTVFPESPNKLFLAEDELVRVFCHRNETSRRVDLFALLFRSPIWPWWFLKCKESRGAVHFAERIWNPE